MALVLKHYIKGKDVEFKNSTELKDFLVLQNPKMLARYKTQIKQLHPEIIIDGIGEALRIRKSE